MEAATFESMELDARLLRAVGEMGFAQASPIQEQVVTAENGQELQVSF